MNKKSILAGVVIAATLSALMVEPAFAQASGGVNVEGVLQNILDMLTGTVAKLIATIALILIGIGWMFMGLDWRKAGVYVLGIIVVFGAPQIVNMFVGS
ncbi:TrbC/VirB2 family protein [Microvirga puerhi]|uniref:TrbC/VirB2 family protein n=1 Tax=Microvirga puerhi TaxID=2876078 RepID=A0ABS7VV96_9HYPH|nr:TrbC/VirB2 family protein [Microvirga puerhi]MBZ6078837.1 TrbC/VirB2 family protein [Microvirga puerhi]